MGFSVESMIRGYHEYKSIWDNPSVCESLICEREVGNCYDTHAVAIKKNIEGDIKTVGHIPRKISAICSIFIRRGGSIVCLVDGSRRYSSDLPQGGLEIPCILKFWPAIQMKQTRRGNSWSLYFYTQVILPVPILQHFQAKLWQSQWWIGNY